MDRQINSMGQAETKTKQQIRALAKKGDTQNCKFLAKEMIRARKSRNRMESSKATLNSVSMQLNEQMATIKITGTLKKSTVLMKEVNSLVKLPELTATMAKLQMEMTKAGIMDEMVSDVLDMDELEDDELEEADAEVNKILQEITGEQFQGVSQVPTHNLPETSQNADEEEEEANLEAMRTRLAALRE